MREVEQVIEKILAHFAGPEYQSEMHRAKKDFFESAGVLDENSEHFELRMSQFFDWYFFTRELSSHALTPLEACHMPRELRFSTFEQEIIERLKKHRHSLFEFIKVKGSDVHLKDLFANEKVIVKHSPWTDGFNENEIFEARLVPYQDSYIFMKGFCFHPMDAKKFILSEVKKYRKNADLNPDDLMLRLLKMRYKFEQYKHVKLEMIYSNESKLGI